MTQWKIARPEDVYTASILAQFRKSGGWGEQIVWDLFAAWNSSDPGDVAVIDEKRSLTIGDIHDQALGLAGCLADMGVGAGDRVLVQLPNSAEAVIAYGALARMGAIVIPAQMALRERELFDLVGRTSCSAIITINHFRDFDHLAMAWAIQAEFESIRCVVHVGPPEDDGLFELAVQGAPYEGPAPAPDDPFGIIFTSGTTSLPKGCVHTSNTILFSGRGTSRALGVTRDDVVFMPSPIMHSTGLAVGVLGPLVHRCRTVLQTVWNAETALDLISRHGCSVTLGATPFGVMMLKAYDPDRHDVSKFRLFGLAGAPIPSSVVTNIREVLGCQVMSAYGSTEALVVTATLLDDPVERISSTDGTAVPGVEVFIAGEDGRPLAADTPGEIIVRTPGRFICYWDDDLAMAESLDGEGRLRTGDLGRMSEDGYLRLTGRLKEMIIRGGVNISVHEIEEILLSHPRITDAAVVGMPDERLGERACAYLVTVDGAPIELGAIQEFLDEGGLAKYKWPERIECIDELPRNPTGKVMKFKLRDDVEAKLKSVVQLH